jgi:glycosyltransferase involved in cell wall biosynthesis
MTICHVVPSLEERHGGPSKSVRGLALAQAQAGLPTSLLATAAAGAPPPPPVDGLPIRVFPRSWPEAVCASRGLRAALRAAAPDIVHHHALWLRTLHYARQALPAGGRLVIAPRGMMSAWAWRHHRAQKRFADLVVHPGALRAAAGWHATSEKEAEEIRALGFTQPICVAPNGIAAPSADAIETARQYWLAACPEAAHRPVALYYSRFHRKKRLLELIDLWLERAPREWLLLVVGIPEEYRVDMLEEYVLRSLGTQRVRVFDGVGRPPPYALAQLFLLASHTENFGLVIAEAMAHGVAPLVSDGTPWGRINRENVGWCVPWTEFGDALEAAALEGPARLRARGERARAWVLGEYSWDRPARALAEFYERLRAGG